MHKHQAIQDLRVRSAVTGEGRLRSIWDDGFTIETDTGVRDDVPVDEPTLQWQCPDTGEWGTDKDLISRWLEGVDDDI